MICMFLRRGRIFPAFSSVISYARNFLLSTSIFIRKPLVFFNDIQVFAKGRFITCIFLQLYHVKCILIVTRGFSVRFPVTHFKFPGDNVPASPAKETAWIFDLCILCIVLYALFSMHCILFIVFFAL